MLLLEYMKPYIYIKDKGPKSPPPRKIKISGTKSLNAMDNLVFSPFWDFFRFLGQNFALYYSGEKTIKFLGRYYGGEQKQKKIMGNIGANDLEHF